LNDARITSHLTSNTRNSSQPRYETTDINPIKDAKNSGRNKNQSANFPNKISSDYYRHHHVTNMPMQRGRLHNLQKPNAVLSEQVKQTARGSLLSPTSLAHHTRHALSWSRHSTSSSSTTEPNCLAVHAPDLSSISDSRPADAALHDWSSSGCQDAA
jgi:hypothetical protein